MERVRKPKENLGELYRKKYGTPRMAPSPPPTRKIIKEEEALKQQAKVWYGGNEEEEEEEEDVYSKSIK